MKLLIAIALGGALGALSRHGLSTLINDKFGNAFPVGILSTNILGCLLMGCILALMSHSSEAPEPLKAFVVIGFLGAFTTFSAFSVETISMINRGDIFPAMVYIGSSVFFSIGATFLGLFITKQIVH